MTERIESIRAGDSSPLSFAENWGRFTEENPEEGAKVMGLAQKIFAIDQITVEGVKQAIESPEMAELCALLESNKYLRESLGIANVDPHLVLFIVNLYATDLLFSHERKLSGAS